MAWTSLVLERSKSDRFELAESFFFFFFFFSPLQTQHIPRYFSASLRPAVKTGSYFPSRYVSASTNAQSGPSPLLPSIHMVAKGLPILRAIRLRPSATNYILVVSGV